METVTTTLERARGDAIAFIVQATPYKWHGYFPYKGGDKDTRQLVEREAQQLVAEGYHPENIIEIVMNGDGRAYVLPRNLAWASLPVVMDPVFDYGICHAYRFMRDNDGKLTKKPMVSREKLTNCFPLVDRIVVVDVGVDFADRILWEAIAPVWSVAKLPPRITLATNTGSTDMPEDRGAGLELKYRGHDRFVFNYILNMLIIGGRARYKAATMSRQPWRAWNGRLLYHEDQSTNKMDVLDFASPETIQFLMEIGRFFPEAVADDPDEHELTSYPRRLCTLPFFEMNGADLMFCWVGSGKYAPLVAKVCGPEGDTFRFDRRRSCDSFAANMTDLFHGGYIASFNGAVRLTTQGRAMIDLLGPELDDADVLLRWRTEDGRICAESNIPEADRWLQRKFRQLKRRVAGLPASPFSEPDVHFPARPTHKNVIRGAYADLASLPMIERLAVASRVEAMQAHLPVIERRMGVVYDRMAMRPMETPIGLWVGFPLSPAPIDRDLQWGNWGHWANMDTDVLDSELPRLLAAVPDWLQAFPFGSVRFLTSPSYEPTDVLPTTGRVDADSLIIRENLPDVPPRRIGNLVYGKAVAIHDDLERWVRSGRLRDLGIGTETVQDGDDFRTSGFWRYGFRSSDSKGILFGQVAGVCAFRLGPDQPTSVPYSLKPELLTLPAMPDTWLGDQFEMMEAKLWCLDSPLNGRVLREVTYDAGAAKLSVHVR